MALALDHHANSQSSGGTTTTISVTATAGSDIILGCLVGTNNTTTLPVLSVTGAAGLTWTQIGTNGGAAFFNSRFYALTAWHARCPGGLSAATVTITSTVAIDDAATVFASYTGAVSPFLDPNGALPIQVFNTNHILAAEENYTTTDAPDLLFAFIGSNQNNLQWLNPASPAGSTVVDSVTNGGGIYDALLGLMTVPVSSPQAAVLYGSTYATTSNWVFIGGALVGSAPPSSRPFLIRPGRVA